MAAHGAVRLGRMVANLERILGIELICAAQGVEFRAPLRTSPALARVVAALRRTVPVLAEDRYLAPDLQAAATLIRGGDIIAAADLPMPEVAP